MDVEEKEGMEIDPDNREQDEEENSQSGPKDMNVDEQDIGGSDKDAIKDGRHSFSLKRTGSLKLKR